MEQSSNRQTWKKRKPFNREAFTSQMLVLQPIGVQTYTRSSFRIKNGDSFLATTILMNFKSKVFGTLCYDIEKIEKNEIASICVNE